MQRKFFAFIVAFLFCSFWTGPGISQQPGYSESEVYIPRQIPSKKKAKKFKKENAPSDSAAPDDRAKINSGPLVVPVTVLNRNGKVVTDLKESDFTVFVDEAEVKPSAVLKQIEPINLVLLVDTSPSASFSEKRIQAVANSIVKGLDPRCSVTVVGFNMNTKVHLNATTDREKTYKVLDDLDQGDGTSLYEAVRFIFEKVLPQTTGPSAMVILTDGVDTTSRIRYEDSLLFPENADTTVHTVFFDTYNEAFKDRSRTIRNLPYGLPPGFGLNTSQREEYAMAKMYLSDLARLSGGRVLESKEFDSDETINIGDELASRYLVTIDGMTGESGQRRSIRIRINRPGLTVLARGSYLIGANRPSVKSDKK